MYKKNKIIRRLYGIISDISDKKIIIGGHNDTIEKLKKIIPNNGRHPVLDGNKFYIQSNINVPTNLIGEKVEVWVYVKKYDFASTFIHNKGERIIGWNLVLEKIEKNIDWS